MAGAADSPSLQELLGKAQTQTERKAVEDLVDKLQGGARKPAPAVPAPAPASAPPPSTAPPVTAAPAPELPKPPAPTASPAAPPAPAPPDKKTAAPATITPQAAVQSAERKELPSVDLEVFFDYKAAQITPQAAGVLTTLGRALVDARLAGNAFLIAGHTDAKGSDDYNLALSEQRAEAVRQFLIRQFQDRPRQARGQGLRSPAPEKPEAAPRPREPPRPNRQPIQVTSRRRMLRAARFRGWLALRTPPAIVLQFEHRKKRD